MPFVEVSQHVFILHVTLPCRGLEQNIFLIHFLRVTVVFSEAGLAWSLRFAFVTFTRLAVFKVRICYTDTVSEAAVSLCWAEINTSRQDARSTGSRFFFSSLRNNWICLLGAELAGKTRLVPPVLIAKAFQKAEQYFPFYCSYLHILEFAFVALTRLSVRWHTWSTRILIYFWYKLMRRQLKFPFSLR